jgi:hypothetical protein
MPEIGIRIYKLALFDNHIGVKFGTPGLGEEPEQHFRAILGHQAMYNDLGRQRTYRPEALNNGADYAHGLLQYGNYGIASTLQIGVLQPQDEEGPVEVQVVRRGELDVEEIPLYYMFHFPADEKFAYIAFQTYQTRSCATLVLGHLIQSFNDQRVHLGQRLTVQKVMLSAAEDPVVRASPVKEVILVRNRMPADRFNRYVRNAVDKIRLKITIGATRGSTLGSYIGLFNEYQAHQGDILLFEGIEFQKAIALVEVGGKLRKVNLLGYDSSAGVIDISDQVELDDDGEYPTADSMEPVFRSSISDVAEMLAAMDEE